MLLITTIFSSFLIPAAVVLFVSSTPAIRRRPSFILNLCAIILGLTQGAISLYITISEITNPPQNATLISISIGLYVVVPLCVQTTLLLRVLAVYPPRLLSLPLCIGMYGPVIAMKAARIGNACYLIYTAQRSNNGAPVSVLSVSAAVWTSPYAKAEWFLQLVDDVYVSALFLLRLQIGMRFIEKQSRSRTSYEPTVAEHRGPGARLRTLFWIALSNFVFPAIFDVAQLVLIFRDPNYIHGSYVVSSNSYISILGVLFSTIWASGWHQMGEASQVESSVRSHTNPHGTANMLMGHLSTPPRSLSRAHPPLAASSQTKVGIGSTSELGAHSGEGDSSEDLACALHVRTA